MAINADKDDHILYNGQHAENEDKGEEYIISKSAVASIWERYQNQCFADYRKYIPITIEMKSSDIPNLYFITDFYATLILEIAIWSKLFYGSFIRYAGIHIIENVVGNR